VSVYFCKSEKWANAIDKYDMPTKRKSISEKRNENPLVWVNRQTRRL